MLKHTLEVSINVMCTSVLFACMYVYQMCAWLTQSSFLAYFFYLFFVFHIMHPDFTHLTSALCPIIYPFIKQNKI